MSRILVLHSGGMDSTALLFEAKRDGAEVLSFGIEYRQRHSIESMFAARQAKRIDVPRVVVSIEWSKPNRAYPLDRTPDQIGDDISTAFLPGRNVLFFSVALAHAAGWGADEVWTGINSIDFSGYPDCTPEFFNAYVTMYSIAAPESARLVAPLLLKSKVEIAEMAQTLGLQRGDTWSCYRPQITSLGGIEICGRCDACVLHAHAWDAIEIKHHD